MGVIFRHKLMTNSE